MEVFGDYSYTSLTGFQYTGFVDKTVYKTKEKALVACSKNSKCTVSHSSYR